MPDGQSSIQAVSPVVTRLQAVMSVLTEFVRSNADPTLSHFVVIIEALEEELIEELEDRDTDTLASFMDKMGEVIAWIGHGDNSRLPEELRVFAREASPVIEVTPEEVSA
jgi:hypothetical protein